MASMNETDRSRAIWRSCLEAAFKTALACTIVGCVTLYGPETVRREIAFPAFSYVTVILIVTDASLGDTIRGCWLAFYASFQGIFPAVLSLWVIGPSRLTAGTTAAAVAVSAFVVVLPENTHLIAKRIALGQIVIVYVIAYINGMHIHPIILHPIRVAASTALGVVACVLALLFPYRSLACREVRENCKLFAENASQRLKLFLKSFLCKDNASRQAFISQEKSLSLSGAKLLQNIKSKQGSMQWERFPMMFFNSYCANPGQRLQEVERILRGIEVSLTNCSQIPIRLATQELENDLITSLEQHIFSNKTKTAPLSMTIIPQSQPQNDFKFLQNLHTMIPMTDKDLPFLFFLFCLRLLQVDSSPNLRPKQEPNDSEKPEKGHFEKILSSIPIQVNKKRLLPAFKSSLSLGLAVLLGSIYSKENGYWAGLPVAISLASSREATFKLTNAKAQGTVVGTVYGVLCCFIFGKYIKLRFLSLIPWFIFTKFLCKSKMYGQAGGISAVIGAVLILGREHFGPPTQFAIARIVETFIGLSCSILVDILLQPTRASTMAKIQLSKMLSTLHEYVGTISLRKSSISDLDEHHKTMKSSVNELKKAMDEAGVEPNFWFLPFNATCYNKLLDSTSKMVDFFLFASQAFKLLDRESKGIDSKVWKESVSKLDCDLKLFKETIGNAMKCMEKISLIKSLGALDEEFEKRKGSLDLEIGKGTPMDLSLFQFSVLNEDDRMEQNVKSFLLHSDEFVRQIRVGKDEGEIKNQVILSLSAIAFCMERIMKETKEMERAMKEVVQWENPSRQIVLYDILCKIHAISNDVTI